MSAKKDESNGTVTKEFQIANKLGIHARPAAMFVKVANRFRCNILSKRTARKSTARASWG